MRTHDQKNLYTYTSQSCRQQIPQSRRLSSPYTNARARPTDIYFEREREIPENGFAGGGHNRRSGLNRARRRPPSNARLATRPFLTGHPYNP